MGTHGDQAYRMRCVTSSIYPRNDFEALNLLVIEMLVIRILLKPFKTILPIEPHMIDLYLFIELRVDRYLHHYLI